MNAPRFPIGFWNYMSMDVFKPEDLKDWQDAAFSVIMSPAYVSGNAEHQAKLRVILDWCREQQVQIILQDSRTSIWRFRNHSPSEKAKLPDDYKAGVKEAVAEFAGYPEVIAYSVIDEPTWDIYEATVEAVKIVKRCGGAPFGFVNFIPYWEDAKNLIGREDFGAYLEEYVEETGTPVISYDFYKQMSERNVEAPGYYTNLNLYRRVSANKPVVFWNTILTTPHFRYRKPSYDDMRWQMNTSLAYGAKGILCFTFYTPNNEGQLETNYRQGPINWWGERTDTFQAIRDVNREIHERWNGLFLELDLKRVEHFPEVPIDRVERFSGGGIVKDIRLGLGMEPHLIVSEFVRRSTLEDYVFIVNANPRDSIQIALCLGSIDDVRRYDSSGKECLVKSDRGESFDFQFWLAPGQGELFKIVRS